MSDKDPQHLDPNANAAEWALRKALIENRRPAIRRLPVATNEAATEKPTEQNASRFSVRFSVIEVEAEARADALDVEALAVAAAARLEGKVSRLQAELDACTAAFEAERWLDVPLTAAAQRREDAEEAIADYEAALHEAWSETGEQPSDAQEEQRGHLAHELAEAVAALRAILAERE